MPRFRLEVGVSDFLRLFCCCREALELRGDNANTTTDLGSGQESFN